MGIDWLDIIKPYTAKMAIYKDYILLLHPHFSRGKDKKRFVALLKALKNNKYHNTTVECTGFATIKGMIIINSIKNYLLKHNIASDVDIGSSLYTGLYRLKVRLI